MGSPRGFSRHEVCSFLLDKRAEATARAPTRHSPADPERQSQLPAQHGPVPCPCCPGKASSIIPHGWSGIGGFTETMRAEGWEEEVHSYIIHLLGHWLPQCWYFSRPESEPPSSMGHLASRVLCYLSQSPVLKARPSNSGVPCLCVSGPAAVDVKGRLAASSGSARVGNPCIPSLLSVSLLPRGGFSATPSLFPRRRSFLPPCRVSCDLG